MDTVNRVDETSVLKVEDGKPFVADLSYYENWLPERKTHGISETVTDGQIRILNTFFGTLTIAKPDKNGNWTVSIWMTQMDRSNEGSCELILEVMRAGIAPNYMFEVENDNSENTDVACRNLSHFLSNLYIKYANQRDENPIYARIPNLRIEGKGGSCPYQADGTWNGYEFYFRYRGGWAELRVGGPVTISDEDGFQGDTMMQNPHWRAGLQYSQDPYDGYLTAAQFAELFCLLASQIKPVEEFCYQFEPLASVINGEKVFTAFARATDAMSARRSLKDYPYEEDENNRKWEIQPKYEDYRIYPWPAIQFPVLDEPSAK